MVDLKKLRESSELFKLKDMQMGIFPETMLEILDKLESSQKDAARYQWLRDNCIKRGVVIDVGAGAEIPDTLDEAVDDAIASKS